MPDPTTTNLVLAVPVRGADSGTWDTPVNGDMQIIDACAGNVTAISVSNVNVTLSTSQSQVSIIRLSGTVTGAITITLGAIIKSWIIENNTANNGFAMLFRGSTGTGNAIMPPPGSCQIYWDGTNVSFINLGPRIGNYEDFATQTVPLWISSCTIAPFLNCDGTTYNTSTYPLLAGILNSNVLPDLRGRARFAIDGNQSRITSAVSGIDGNSRFAFGGNQSVQLVQANLPAVNFPTSLAISDTRTWQVNTSNQLIVSGGGSSFGGGAAGSGVSPSVIVSGGSISLTGAVNSGGTGNPVVCMPPTWICGIMMIRAG